MTPSFESRDRFPADHPALAGHFPGSPIVPGVVLLNLVARTFRQWQPAACIASWPQVKFVSPLLPDEDFVIRLIQAPVPGVIRFTLHVDARLVASGQFTLDNCA